MDGFRLGRNDDYALGYFESWSLESVQGVIDAAESNGARVVFSDVNESTAELFEMLGVTRHVQLV